MLSGRAFYLILGAFVYCGFDCVYSGVTSVGDHVFCSVGI